jgi:hypothetical protein
MKQGQSSVQLVSQVMLRLESSTPKTKDRFQRTVHTILKWMDKRAGRPLPKEAWAGKAFEHEEVGAQRAAAVSLEDPQYWCARLDDADKTVPGRTWATEIAVAAPDAAQVVLGVRLVCVTRGDPIPFPRSLPGFLHEVIAAGPVLADGVDVSGKPSLIRDRYELEWLEQLLLDPARRLPVVAISLPDKSVDPKDAVISADEIARRTQGAAHVVVVSGPATFGLSDAIGNEFSVYRGAVRTYRPRFNPDQDQLYRHPFASAEKIAAWPNGGTKAFETFVVEHALSLSVAGQDLEDLLPPFTTVRRIAAQLTRQKAREQGASDKDVLAVADAEIEALRKDLQEQKDTYDGLLATAEAERDLADQAAQEARAQTFALRQRIEALQKQLDEGAAARGVSIPDSLDGFEEWCRTHLSGSVLLHNRAFQGIKKSHFGDVKLIYKALLLLRDRYVPMRREGGPEYKQAFDNACTELRLEETATGNPGTNKRAEYTVQYAGMPRFLERHLKQGQSKDPRITFRLYFFWDEAEEQVVVGWLPSHLESRLT